MFQENIKPLKQKHRVPLPDTLENEALRVLAGMFCSVCDQPLSTVDRKDNWGHAVRHSAYTCCGMAHCPYCGRNGKEKCEHLVAYHAHKRWYISGLPDIAEIPYAQAPLILAALLNHTLLQRQEAFCEDFPLMNSLFWPWHDSLVLSCLDGFAITNHIIRPENTQCVGEKSNSFYFSTTTAGLANRLHHAFYNSIPEGLKRLNSNLLSSHPYVTGGFELPYILNRTFQGDKQLAPTMDKYTIITNTWTIRERRSTEFSSCGKYLIAMNAICVQIWNMEEQTPQYICTLSAPIDPISGKQSYYHNFRIDSSDNSIHVSRSSLLTYREESTEHWDTHSLIDGSLLHSEVGKAYFPAITDTEMTDVQRNYDAVLHHGKSCLVIKDRSLILYCLAPSGRRGRKKLCIPLNRGIGRIAISPDGETFATLTDRLVCIWRIPHCGNYRSDHVL